MNKTLIAKFVQKPMTSADCTVTRRVTSAVQRQPGFPQCQHQVQGRYRDAIINSEHRVIRQIQAMICSVIWREWFRRIFQDQKKLENHSDGDNSGVHELVFTDTDIITTKCSNVNRFFFRFTSNTLCILCFIFLLFLLLFMNFLLFLFFFFDILCHLDTPYVGINEILGCEPHLSLSKKLINFWIHIIHLISFFLQEIHDSSAYYAGVLFSSVWTILCWLDLNDNIMLLYAHMS